VDRFRELIREDPAESGPLWAAVGVLEKQDQIDSALQLIDEWLQGHGERDLTWAGVTSLKSRLLRKRGRFQEAWNVAQTAAMTWKADCLEEASLALIDLGRLDEALKMAMSMRERYGDDSAAALVARILWMKGRDDEAAQVLTSPQKQLDASAWSSGVPTAFSEAFPKGNETRAEEAFVKLAVPSVPTLNILWFIEHLTTIGRPDLALKFCERLRGRGPTGWMTVATYHAMLKAQGAPAAREWLRANSTPAEQDILAKQGLQEADYELVWALPDHPDATKNEILYLIRAACLLHQPEAQENRRAQLIKFFESRPKKDFVVYGLFLLGQVDRPTLFAQINDLSYVSSVGWLVGLTSAHENHYDEANEWLQVCMETGADIPPRYWASVTLGRWNKEGRTLAEVARKRIY
jgi:tetratricopeptide (TPR) repeat protein